MCVAVCQQHVDIGWVRVVSSVHLLFLGIRRVFTVERRSKKGHVVVFYSTVCVGKIGKAKCKICDPLGGVVETLGRFWKVLGGSGGPFGDVFKPLGRFGGVLEGFWEPLGGLLGASWNVLGASWTPLGGSCRLLGEF